MVQKNPKITETRFRLGVEDDEDSNGSGADLTLRRGGEAVSDEGPLQLEEGCDELGDHPPDGEKDPGALLGSLDEAWNEHSLEASDDEASVDDAIDVALVTWTVQLLRLMVIQPTWMSQHRCQQRWQFHRWRNQPAAKAYQALSQWCLRGNHHIVPVLW